jgi:hypothetical protein
MGGLTGKTSNKLFKVKTLDSENPYKVGQNGVISVSPIDGSQNLYKVKYIIDNITYTSFTVKQSEKNLYSKDDLITSKKGTIIQNKKNTNLNNPSVIEKKQIGISKNLKFIPDFSKGSPVELLKKQKPKNNFNFDLQGNLILNRSFSSYSNGVEPRDTIFETKKLSYDNFIQEKIFKNNRYVGLIDKPNVDSDLFMERDNGSVFERHQRLSEINNFNDLKNYLNGYYKLINTI